MIDREMNKSRLKDLAKVSSKVIAKLGKDEFASIEKLVKIYAALGVDNGDIIELKN